MATNKGITVEQLYLECARQIKAGNGKKHILLSGDNEGNSFHECFFGFTPTTEFDFSHPIMQSTLPFGLTVKKVEKSYIVLG